MQYRELSRTDLLSFFAMIIGMFMAVLDIQIVASSISVIGAGLSASADELSWVQTAYIIAEVIVIPSTGFLAKLLSTRILYFGATLGFTIMSVACSLAWNIESMIVFRALQGIFGGAMIPTAFATSFMIFPPEKRAKVSIIIGLVVTMAPTLGPTIGGYLTDLTSWHLMFLLNVIPGLFVCAVIFLYCNFDKPNKELLNNFDYLGVILLFSCLGSLEYILEEGAKLDWFESSLVISLSAISAASLLILIYNELNVPNPILGLRAFQNRNFIIGSIYSAMIGMGLYGSVYLLPLFLYRVAAMTSLQIGIVMMVTGVFQFLSAPIAGKLYDSLKDKRIVLAIGMILLSAGCYLNSNLTPESRYTEFFLPQAVRGFALMFCFIPVNNIALGTIAKSDLQNASGLYNLMRNLGGAVGLALINLALTNYTKISSQYLASGITITDSFKLQPVKDILISKSIENPDIVAMSFINNIISRDAFIISMNNIFLALALMFCCSIILIPFASNIDSHVEESH